MKQLLMIFLIAAFAIGCSKEQSTEQQCGEVVSIRVCGVCAQQPSWVVDVYFPNTGKVVGFPVQRIYSIKEPYCITK